MMPRSTKNPAIWATIAVIVDIYKLNSGVENSDVERKSISQPEMLILCEQWNSEQIRFLMNEMKAVTHVAT